jgi:hypothetical protein
LIELLGNSFNEISQKIIDMLVLIIPIGLVIFGAIVILILGKKLLYKVIGVKEDKDDKEGDE